MTHIENLPPQLQPYPHFCCWRYEERNGRKTKVPYNPRTGGMAQSNNPDTFAPLSIAAGAMRGYEGLGVGIFGTLGAIDIDHCVKDGALSDMAVDIIDTMNSYTEYSPSGEGIRILFYAPGFQYDTGRYYINNQKRGLEVYIAGCTKKYVTVTGNALFPGVLDIEERKGELARVLEKYMVRPAQAPAQDRGAPMGWNEPIGGPGTVQQPSPLDDLALLQRAKAAKNGALFERLYAGDTFGYNSQSEAELALCNQLAFWTGRDPERMDALFRQSGLMRDKWDRRQSGTTYGAMTIQRAIQGCREVYTPKTPSGKQTAAPKPEGNPRKRPELETVSAAALMRMQLPPVQWVVVNLIPSGFNLLASPPKYGKSWWVLDLCLSVASGASFMGREVIQGRCLYLALEDSKNRLKSRLYKLLNGQPPPAQFDFATQAADLDNGLLEQLETYVSEYPDAKLIVIDTFQKVRGESKRSEGAYQADYREAGRLKAFADAHNLAILCVHHLRKMADDTDPFNRISGTNGISGAADTMLVMTRKNRTDVNTTLSITGRDVEMSEEIITFEKESCRWRRIGTADHLAQQAARMEYDQEPMVQAVQSLVKQYPEGWSGTASELMEACGSELGWYPETTVRAYTDSLKRLKPQLLNYDGIRVDLTGKRHNSRLIRLFRGGSFSGTQLQIPPITPSDTEITPSQEAVSTGK